MRFELYILCLETTYIWTTKPDSACCVFVGLCSCMFMSLCVTYMCVCLYSNHNQIKTLWTWEQRFYTFEGFKLGWVEGAGGRKREGRMSLFLIINFQTCLQSHFRWPRLIWNLCAPFIPLHQLPKYLGLEKYYYIYLLPFHWNLAMLIKGKTIFLKHLFPPW